MGAENAAGEEKAKDIEKGEGENQQETGGLHFGRMQRLSATNPLRLVVESATRVATPSPASVHIQHTHPAPPPPPANTAPRPSPAPSSQPRSTPTPQASLASLNSRSYTNKMSLILFLVHLVLVFGLVCFLIFKGVEGILRGGRTKRDEIRILEDFLPQIEAAAFLSITLAVFWQKAIRVWPKFMVRLIIWGSFLLSLTAGILLICFQRPSTDALGVVFVFYSIGNGLYACWVTTRTGFCSRIFIQALEPVSKFHDINRPTFWMLLAGFLWMSLWILAVIGALNFYFPPLVIIVLVLSLAWTTEVMRNVVNITVSRVIALYYLRGMQSSTPFCFQRALSQNLGSACLGSVFVPTIEFLRIVARGLNLIEGEDEFMFCCARCGLKVMDSVFKRGNGWAYVQIASYGKSFVKASQDTWELFERRGIEQVVDADITSAVCFLTGVCSGCICVIVVAAWTGTVHRPYTATVSLLSVYIGYLLTRIAMALPQACVGCYYVCYAENPDNRLFDKTIEDRLNFISDDRHVVVPTPRSISSR